MAQAEIRGGGRACSVAKRWSTSTLAVLQLLSVLLWSCSTSQLALAPGALRCTAARVVWYRSTRSARTRPGTGGCGGGGGAAIVSTVCSARSPIEPSRTTRSTPIGQSCACHHAIMPPSCPHHGPIMVPSPARDPAQSGGAIMLTPCTRTQDARQHDSRPRRARGAPHHAPHKTERHKA